MACPFFYPQDKFDDKTWRKPPRLPLGDPYKGMCRVDPMREWRPDETTLRNLCNVGYARNACPRFPKGAGPDAIRFTASSERNGTLQIYYVVEKSQTPLEHGPLEYSLQEARFVEANCGDTIRKQAQAYVESYLRRKHQPQDDAHNPHRR